MATAKRGLRLNRELCKSCVVEARRPAVRVLTSRLPHQTSPARPHSTIVPFRRKSASLVGRPTILKRNIHVDHHHIIAAAVDPELKRAQELSNRIFDHSSVPAENEVADALNAIKSAAIHVLKLHDPEAALPVEDETTSPASALLNLDSKKKQPKAQTSQPLTKTVEALSNLAYRLVKQPTVFITPAILETYIKIQCVLLRPLTFPEIFDLYATKPAPVQSTSPDAPITYKSQDPFAIAAAVPVETADSALSAAIAIRDLPLALSIISTTYQTSAFRRSKVFRKALPPAIGAGMAPVAAYMIASQLSLYQTALDPQSFTTIAFAGMFTYVMAVGTIGTVALTTANDQMERVTWAIGMPLRERWIREEERAAVDRVAMAWGFREKWRRGEEEGEEWEALREWIGLRGMVLDKIGLMEGME